MSVTAVTLLRAKLSQKREKLGNGEFLGMLYLPNGLEFENWLSQHDEELSSVYLGTIAQKNCRILLKVSHKWVTLKTLTPLLSRPLRLNVATFGISIAEIIFNVPTKFGRDRITPRGSKTPELFLWK